MTYKPHTEKIDTKFQEFLAIQLEEDPNGEAVGEELAELAFYEGWNQREAHKEDEGHYDFIREQAQYSKDAAELVVRFCRGMSGVTHRSKSMHQTYKDGLEFIEKYNLSLDGEH